MTSTNRDSSPSKRRLRVTFTLQQIAQLEKWREGREGWTAQVVDNVEMDTETIVVDLPSYLDVDGLGLNLRNWVIYPSAGDSVRVLFWDDCESLYPELEAALTDIALLRARKT